MMLKYNNINQFIFDVDGTLVDSSLSIDNEFGKFLRNFFINNKCYIVTGASYTTTLRQLGSEICNAAEYMINCGGSHIHKKGREIFASQWTLSQSKKRYLENFLRSSQFPYKTGNHFDDRVGMCNFSILGRNTSFKQRKDYVAWDLVTNERAEICKKFNLRFKKEIARVAGETGIDISHSEISKAVMLKYLDDVKTAVFFGDKTEKGGNDYPLAKKLDYVHQIDNWHQSFELLLEYDQSGP